MSANGSAVAVFDQAVAAFDVWVTADATADRTKASKPNAIRFASLISLRLTTSMRFRATSLSGVMVAGGQLSTLALCATPDGSADSGYSIRSSMRSARLAAKIASETSKFTDPVPVRSTSPDRIRSPIRRAWTRGRRGRWIRTGLLTNRFTVMLSPDTVGGVGETTFGIHGLLIARTSRR